VKIASAVGNFWMRRHISATINDELPHAAKIDGAGTGQILRNSYDVDLGLAMSGSFLATIPLVVLFAFVGRRMVAGILDGAFKC
jgi:cellobiose transport system permease protein